MEVIQSIQGVVNDANKKLEKVFGRMNDPNNPVSLGELMALQMKQAEVGITWSFAGSMVKDLTDPLKSIVNK
ncbi:MAG TPA: hypothetical protein VGE55_13235 [Limnobacter sp.]|uniref:hypothetical protein n=1 Tax=Limnobacter sp. TaxID=2003368 RepID=UPI002EDA66B8